MAKAPFDLSLLPPKIDYMALFKEALDARTALGELNGRVKDLPEPDLLISPLLMKEAELSSRIEGTQVTLEDVFEYEAAEKVSQVDEKERDSREILNYREAMRVALDELKARPVIGENLLKRIHFILLDSIRGANKDKGNLRRMQVYIAPKGLAIDNATYVPPLLTNWENYVNDENQMDALIQIGVAHYQFEAIHPFMDGNGRIGRLLIPLFLHQRGFLTHPVLYISEYFEANRREYYDLLNHVDTEEDWESWLKFFLVGIRTQAEKSHSTISEMFTLYNKTKNEIANFKSRHAFGLLDIIFAEPIVSFATVRKKLTGVTPQTIYNHLDEFVVAGILEETTEKKRNKQYRFTRLLRILE